VFIGNSLTRFGRISRMPGAVARAGMVRGLERSGLRFRLYGHGWRSASAKGQLPREQQIPAIQQALMSANWDHYPTYESYFSDRLPISLLAGRVHVTTYHPGLEWLPGPDDGLFMEKSVSAVLDRVQELARRPADELIALGQAARRRVIGRMSHHEAARFMLGAADERLLALLPAWPWDRLPR
jgi:hypothetical protein